MKRPDPAAIVRHAITQVGVDRLSLAYGLSRQAIARWRARGYVPWRRVALFAELTGVPRHIACWPVYGHEAHETASDASGQPQQPTEGRPDVYA